MRVVSTFAGLGGSSFGYEQAGFEVVGAVEFQDDIADVYEANHSAPVYVHDLRDIAGGELREWFGDFDVLDGSPPCQAFSRNATRSLDPIDTPRAHADQSFQRSDDLIFEWGRLVTEAMPRYAVMENVAPLAEPMWRHYLTPLLFMLRKAGYHLDLHILKAEAFGVPSTRRRMFLLASRDKKWGPWEWPDPVVVGADSVLTPDATALVWRTGSEREYTRRTLRWPTPTITASGLGFGPHRQTALVTDDGLEVDPDSGSRLSPPIGFQAELTRAALHKPIRFLLVDEARRLMGMPELKWPAPASTAALWRMIGNGVPPLLTAAVAARVAAQAS